MMKTNLRFFPFVCAIALLCNLASFHTLQASDLLIFPEKVTDMSATWDVNTGYVTVTMTAPTNSMASLGDGNGEALPYLTKVVLSRNCNYGDYVEVYTFENPTPGATLTFVDKDAQAGLFQYKAVPYVDDCSGYPEWYEIQVGQFPVDINDAVATCNKGQAPVTLMFTAPQFDTEGNTLQSLEKIEVCRFDPNIGEYAVLGNIENPYPGVPYTYDDSDVVSGESYTYRVTPYTLAGKAFGTIINVMVGLDSPVAPTNVTAKVLPDDRIQIVWMASTLGQTNGYVDPVELTYTISRSFTGSEYDAEVLATGVEMWYYVDDTKYVDEAKIQYFVKAVNQQGESVGAPSNPIIVGEPLQLPYSERFDTLSEYGYYTSDHPGWLYESSETACSWYINDVVEMEDRNIATKTGEGGLAFAMYGNYNALEQDDYMTTAKIDLGYKDLFIVAVDYYAFTGSNSTLAIEINPDETEFEEVAKIYYEEMPQEGWTRFAQVVDKSDAKPVYNIQLRLHAHKGTSAQPVIIDNLIVSPLLPVANLRYDYDAKLIKWDAPDDPLVDLTGYRVCLNGVSMVVLSPEETEYDYSSLADEEWLMFGVNAIYEDKYEAEPAVLDMSSVDAVTSSTARVWVENGTLCVEADDNATIEVYSTMGQSLYKAIGRATVELRAGVYLVKVDNKVYKVAL